MIPAFFLSMLILFPFFASAQSLGGGGGGDRPRPISAAHGVLPQCLEGHVQVFHEQRLNAERPQPVLRTCTNGRYYPRAATTRPTTCKNGHIQMFHEARENDGSERVWKMCRAGRYLEITENP